MYSAPKKTLFFEYSSRIFLAKGIFSDSLTPTTAQELS